MLFCYMRLARLMVLTMCVAPSHIFAAEFVPGEAIVQFAEGSESAAIVEQAGRRESRRSDVFAPVMTRLQIGTNLPLRFSRLMSGRGIVLSLDSVTLNDRLVACLRRFDGVVKVEVLSPGAEGGRTAPAPLKIHFMPTPRFPESLHLNREPNQPPESDSLLAGMEKNCSVPLQLRSRQATAMIVQLDLHALTQNLVKKLSLLSDVKSAQLNYIMRVR